ncbi:hypothetical protein V6C27_09435 [Peptococcaceae bacterium 1198_IL3148]
MNLLTSLLVTTAYGRPPSVETFNDRIIAQKVIYLADALGAYAGDYS